MLDRGQRASAPDWQAEAARLAQEVDELRKERNALERRVIDAEQVAARARGQRDAAKRASRESERIRWQQYALALEDFIGDLGLTNEQNATLEALQEAHP